MVHGAWGGAHTWRLLRPILWAAGHQVFTPGLTGIGERVHLVSPHVDLSVHVDDVVNQVLYEDLTDIVLVGYSYGGMVVTGALAHIAGRVRELVYLDAFVPADGQALTDLTGSGPAPAEPAIGSGWLAAAPDSRDLGDPETTQWAQVRRTAQPVRTFTEKVRLPQPLEDYPFGRTYIKALGDARNDGRDVFYEAADRYRDHPKWRYHEHPSDHMIPQRDPAGLAQLLLELL
jgi:pimeloyl-ACP methyl ester carboxylesterase